jgi:type IV secretory pathway VirB10-like protein
MMVRKRLIMIAIIGITLLLMLIIYNLWFANSQPLTPAAPLPPILPDTANTTDTAWFSDPPPLTPPAAAPIVTVPPQPLHLSHPVPIVGMDGDMRAIQAPIISNQINVKAPDHNAENDLKAPPAASLNHKAPTDREKKTFLKAAEESMDNYQLDAKIQNPRGPYEIKTGTIIPAILISGINSDLPGPIIAQVRENVYDSTAGRYLLIPQGAKLHGIYDSAIAYGQQRVLIAWQRLVFPNGQTFSLSGMPGSDVSGYAGFKDLVNNHYERVFGSALFMSLFSAGLQLSQPQQSGEANNTPSVNQILAQNVGISLSQTADQLLRKNLNIQPTLQIRPGYLFNVIVTRDMLF